MKNLRIRKIYCIIGVGLAFLEPMARADFRAIALNPRSYNQDMIVEHPPATTTATLDNGTINTGATFYERGYYTAAAATGLPVAGSTFTSAASATHSYTMAPTYTTNNVILIDSVTTSGTLTAVSPTNFSGLSILAASGNGSASVHYVINHADGSTDSGNFTSPDWFYSSPVAVAANGRLNAVSLAFDSVNSGNPRLYQEDVVITHTTSPVTSIAFSRVSGGHACIFAVSGLTGGVYVPITVTGYNQDVVVEATAAHLPPAGGYSTATMDNGTANTGATWYSIGYNTSAAGTGLPAASNTLANVSALDHQYQMAPDYAANNAVMVDSTHSGNLIPVKYATYSALSFLASAGHGPVDVDYTVYYQDGTSEGGLVSVPDWFNNTPTAFAANGRVDAVSGFIDAVNSGNPRLYSFDISLGNIASAVTNISLSWDAGNTGSGVAAFFALSGTGGAVPPVIGSQPLTQNIPASSPAQLSALVSGTAPIQLHWQKLVQGAYVDLKDNVNLSGSTTSNLTINSPTLGDYGAYRLVATNALGYAVSSNAVLNVISSRSDVTVPGDPISLVGGTTPSGESVVNAIDNSTTKYLNFGVGTGFPPFVGPVGLIVTPSSGSSLVTGLRVYTANDAPERDPADFLLEGSNDDGVTFTFIAQGTLHLPDDRNAPGQALDPIGLFNQEVGFGNSTYYTSYRLMFSTLKNNLAANSVQMGEIELLGDSPNTFTMTVVAPNQIKLEWSQGYLQEATSLLGPWTTDYGVTSPVVVTMVGAWKFYRVAFE